MKKFSIKTLGCKVNQSESEAIGNALAQADQALAKHTDGKADVVIINTCTVTRKAAMQSRQAVRQAIRANPDACIVVTGCHAQMAPAQFSTMDGVDLIVGNRNKHRIHQQILAMLTEPTGNQTSTECPDILGVEQFDRLPEIAYGRRTRPYLKIQDGCNAFCTYCIVPHARGKSRSLPVDQVLNQIDRLGRLGYHEVVLTGIHIGCYGDDLIPAIGLYDLLCRIQAAGTIDRVRVSSIEPAELSDDIVRLAAVDEDVPGRLCPHFHIPLQSGDDGILKRMHRPYRRDDFKALVDRINGCLPHAAIGVDTLIGFPGETHAAFENTYALIQSLPVSYLHVFPFSAREGTPAFSFKDQIPSPEIKKRSARMRALGADKRRRFYDRSISQTITVLVEAARDRDHGRLQGLSGNYIPIQFEGPDDLINTFQRIRVQGISSEGVPVGLCLR